MKRFIVLSAIVLLIAQVLCPLSTTAYDTNGFDYNPDKVIITLTGQDVADLADIKKLKEFLTIPPSPGNPGTIPSVDSINFFGVDIVKAIEITSNTYTITLKNQTKAYYLSQLDFLSVSMGNILFKTNPNIILSIVEDSLPTAEKVNIPNEVLYFTKPNSELDNILFTLSQKDCSGTDFFGVKLSSVSTIARYQPNCNDDTSLVFYSIKLERNDEVSPLIELLNSVAFLNSRNQSFHNKFGYSAIQSHYYDMYTKTPEITTEKNKLIICVNSNNAYYEHFESLTKGITKTESIFGISISSIKTIAKKEAKADSIGYSVYCITMGEGECTESAISIFAKENINASICSYETQYNFIIKTITGDVNGDECVDNLDSAWILKFDAGLISSTEINSKTADVNGDGYIDNLDSAWILKFDAGLISGFGK